MITQRHKVEIEFEKALSASQWLQGLSVTNTSSSLNRPEQKDIEADPGDFDFGAKLTCDTRPEKEREEELQREDCGAGKGE